MGLSWSGVEWRAETGHVVNVYRAAVTHLTMARAVFGNESYGESDPATEQAEQSVRFGSCSPSRSLSRGFQHGPERNADRFFAYLRRQATPPALPTSPISGPRGLN